VSGLIITWKVLEFILGLMGENMKVSIKMIKSMDLGFIAGQTNENTKDIGIKENSTDLEYILFLPMK
jgi:hypothetical protein